MVVRWALLVRSSPFVQRQVGGRHLHGSGDVLDSLIRQFTAAAWGPAVELVKLQHQGEGQLRRPSAPGWEVHLLIEQRPVADQFLWLPLSTHPRRSLRPTDPENRGNTIERGTPSTPRYARFVTTTNRNRDLAHRYFGARVTFGSSGPSWRGYLITHTRCLI
jgi:hypothetical protein